MSELNKPNHYEWMRCHPHEELGQEPALCAAMLAISNEPEEYDRGHVTTFVRRCQAWQQRGKDRRNDLPCMVLRETLE